VNDVFDAVAKLKPEMPKQIVPEQWQSNPMPEPAKNPVQRVSAAVAAKTSQHR
jgi:hypothetical protein